MKLRTILESILTEIKIVAYHGSHSNFETFDLDKVGYGVDQNGPGFYFSSSSEEALGYGEFAHQYELNLRKVVPTKGKVAVKEIQDLIRLSPNLSDKLDDWGENQHQAFRAALTAMVDADSPFHAFTNVWYDFYRDNPKDYLENMIKLGYDGVIISGKEGYGNINNTHIIVFNPKSIKKVKRIS